jgi:hypothetical protein
VLLIYLALQGLVGQPANYGLALSAILLIVISLVAGFARPKVDDLYRVAPRPPFANHPNAAAIAAALVYFTIGLVNRIVVNKELSLLSTDTSTQQIALLAGSGIAENLLIEYLLFSALFAALLLLIGSYSFSLSLALGLSSGLAWMNHYFIYGLDPSYFIFVFASFTGMGLLYWLSGSVMLTIVIHVWWNIGALVWQTLQLPTVAIPGVGCIPYCAVSVMQPILAAIVPLLPGLLLLPLLLKPRLKRLV